MSGMAVEDILKAADWSAKGVFQKFYYRPKHSVAYGASVLAASTSKSHVDMETEPSEIIMINKWHRSCNGRHAIRNYMRKGKLKYQHVPPTSFSLCVSLFVHCFSLGVYN